jgi:hypothetical protein
MSPRLDHLRLDEVALAVDLRARHGQARVAEVAPARFEVDLAAAHLLGDLARVLESQLEGARLLGGAHLRPLGRGLGDGVVLENQGERDAGPDGQDAGDDEGHAGACGHDVR